MARDPVNISYSGSFPGTVKGRPGLDPWYSRQAHKPDVGLGGFDLGPIQDWRLPWSYPARNIPVKYLTVRRQFPVIIPKGRLVSAVQIMGEYAAADQEIGVDSTGKLPVGVSEAQGYNPDTTTYAVAESIHALELDDYYMYGEDWRFVISLANCTRTTVEDDYSTLDLGRVVVTSGGDGKELGDTTTGNKVDYTTVTYPRKPAKPIGYSRAEIFADIRGQYQYYTEDTSIELFPVGSIAIPFIKADGGTTIADADLQPGGAIYDALIPVYTFLPMLTNEGFKDYQDLYGDLNGNYTLTPHPFTGSGTVAVSSGVVTESGTSGVTSFTTEVAAGDKLTIDTTDVVVTSVESDTVMTVVQVSDGSAPTIAGDVAFTVYPAGKNSHKVGYAMYFDLYASKGLNWQIMTKNGSLTMGTDTKGINTRLYKFMNFISNNTSVSAQGIMDLALEGNVGLAYLYVAPIFFD